MTPRRHRRGTTATVFALGLIPMLGFAALAVDIGVLRVADAELQGAVDAAVLAGVGHLDGTSAGLSKAVAATRTVAGRNTVAGRPLELATSDVVSGVYDRETGRFTPSSDAREVDALRVHAVLDRLPTVFAGAAFGVRYLEAEVTSTAIRASDDGAGEVACFLPLAIPDCMFTTQSAQDAEAVQLKFSSAGADNVGWADLDGNPTPKSIGASLRDQCQSGIAAVDDRVYLNNGVITSALTDLDAQVSLFGTPWDASRWGPQPPQMTGSTLSRYGRVLEGPIILFQTTPGTTCGSGVQFNQSKIITGFAWAAVYDVNSKGKDKNVRVKLDFHTLYPVGTAPGGLPTNVTHVGSGGLVP